MEVDDDEGTRDMMGAIEEVVRLREEKEARLASLRAEAEELRARTATEAGRRERAKLKTAEILAPVPVLRQGIWAQGGFNRHFRDIPNPYLILLDISKLLIPKKVPSCP